MAQAATEYDQILAEYHDDAPLYFRECLVVRDHNTSSLVPFSFRIGQRILHNVAEEQLKRQGYVRIWLLKSRRFGGSTYVEGRMYRNTSLNENKNAFIVAHEVDSTTTLFEMAKLFHERNPIAPSTKKSNAKELIFDNDAGTGLKSKYQLATAKNVDAGRSQGIHYLHGCLHEDTLIVLMDGSTKKIKDIESNDIVVVGSGDFACVSNKIPTGKKEVFEVSTWLNNQPVKMSADHKVFTAAGVKKCSDLTKKDWILTPKIKTPDRITTQEFKITNTPRKQNGGTRHLEKAKITLDRGAGYYFGYYLAEGNISHQSTNKKASYVTFTYHKNETFIEKAYNWFGNKYATSRQDKVDGPNRGRTVLYGTFLAELTEQWCGSTTGKHVPSWFFSMNKNFLHGVVEGYLDGDGSKTDKDRISVTSIREKISRQIRRIIIALDYGVPSIAYTEDRYRYDVKTSPVWNIRLTGDTLARWAGDKVATPHKATKYKKQDGRYYVKVKDIKLTGEIANTYDIEVDHPDHNFETTIGVVSNSEVAYWAENSNILINGLMNCIPEPPTGTEVFWESTANGYGNPFQVGVADAYGEGRFVYYEEAGIPFAYHNPKKDWVVVFIPWFIDKSLQKPFLSPREKQDFITRLNTDVFNKADLKWEKSEAWKLQKKYKLRLEQLYWREWAIENKCDGSVDLFHQEYPATVEEAFLSTGSNTFSKSLCDDLESQCDKPITIGDINKTAGKVTVKPNNHGNFTVWEKCIRTDSYFITADIAGGLQGSQVGKRRNKDEEPDKTNIDVWNHRTGNQVAQWNGHIDYDLVSDVIIMIGELYGIQRAKLELPVACVELNNHGFTVVADLERKGYPQYGNIADQKGWQTNKRTKPQMIDGLRDASKDGTLKPNSVSTVSEMRSYIEEGGKYAAAAGCNDDRVITAAIASQLMLLLPRKYQTKTGQSHGAGFANSRHGSSNKKQSNSGYVEYSV